MGGELAKVLIAILALQALAPAPTVAGPPIGTDEVVVVGLSLHETEEALRRCLARHCTPKEDIDATLAHAENQFVAGDFRGARSTLTSSRSRNKRFARELPVPVANLLRVDALVASLVGERDHARIGTIDSVSALKAGLPLDDRRIAAQRLIVAAVFAREGRFTTAVNMYDAVAKRAAEMGWGALQGEAMFRVAALYGMASTVDPAYAGEARHRLRKLEQLSAPEAKSYADAAVLIQIKVAQMRKDDRALAAARVRASTMRVSRPMLLYAPSIDLDNPMSGGNVAQPPDTRDQWVDLSFTISPDGHVHDIEEVARGVGATGRWIGIARQTIAGREYVPLDQTLDGAGIAQMERAVLVADVGLIPASHMRGPIGPPRLQFVNLAGGRKSALGGGAAP